MEHIATVRGRRVADIQSREGDLPGHIVPARNMNVDTLRVKFDDRSWEGYDTYSVIFWRADEDDRPHLEYELDPKHPSVVIPAEMTEEPGIVRFAVKGLDVDGRRRILTENKNARLQVTEGGMVDGSAGNEDQLTRLEDALHKAEDFDALIETVEEQVKRAQEAADKAEAIADMDYDVAKHKPSIEGVTLQGDKELQDLGMNVCKAEDILNLFK